MNKYNLSRKNLLSKSSFCLVALTVTGCKQQSNSAVNHTGRPTFIKRVLLPSELILKLRGELILATQRASQANQEEAQKAKMKIIEINEELKKATALQEKIEQRKIREEEELKKATALQKEVEQKKIRKNEAALRKTFNQKSKGPNFLAKLVNIFYNSFTYTYNSYNYNNYINSYVEVVKKEVSKKRSK